MQFFDHQLDLEEDPQLIARWKIGQMACCFCMHLRPSLSMATCPVDRRQEKQKCPRNEKHPSKQESFFRHKHLMT